MKRKIDAVLLQWAEDPRAQPLLIRGARRVGKTYALKKLGREHFGTENFAYCDFQTDLQNLTQIFEDSRTVEEVVEALELFLHQAIEPQKTLIAFDEVQLCEKALNFLRFFAESEYRVIATGSQLGLTLKSRSLPFPSGITHLYLRPLDFEEFLWAMDEELLAAGIRKAVARRKKFTAHEDALDLYRRYVVVGGMPRAVEAYRENRSLRDARTVQAEIAETYAADIALYAPPNETVRVQQVWSSIPRQIARETTGKFKYADVVSGGRKQQFQNPLAWLKAAELVLINEQTNETSAPLVARDDGSFFKVYLLDTGLLFYRMNLDGELLLDAQKRNALNPRFRGALAENYIMQSLVANGLQPFYWVPKSGSTAEIEFVLQNQAAQVIPIEVKSGSRVSSTSFQSYLRKSMAPFGVRLSEKNIGEDGGIISLPLYAAFCVDENFLMGGAPNVYER